MNSVNLLFRLQGSLTNNTSISIFFCFFKMINKPRHIRETLSTRSIEELIKLSNITELSIDSMLADVTLAIIYYRNAAEPVNEETYKKWFPDPRLRDCIRWLDGRQDFIYTSSEI
jgi:hypothetical protein